MSFEKSSRPIFVHGLQILPNDPPGIRLQKLARVTLDSMVQFVGLLDADGTVLEINKVALDAVDMKLSDVEGRPFWTTFWWQVSEEINATLRQCIARAAQGEFVRWDTPIYGRAGGKETIIIDASLCPVLDDSGKVVFICAEGRDITEKKLREREIAEKNAELHALLERIRELDQVKTQFFANVSHEFRTPLTLILGPLEDAIDDATERWHRDRLLLVQRNALRLQKLVNTLLDLSRLEAGKAKVHYEAVDLGALTTDLASNFRSACEKASLDLHVDCPPLPELAYVDTEMWEKIVLNLLSNAFKFTMDGSITISLRQHEDMAELRVTDTGAGIPGDQVPRLFERFHRVEGVTGRSQEGSGIGLALVRELVRLHGGEVSVESEVGAGSTFGVKIPIGKAARPNAARPAGPALSSSALRATHYVEEALRWLPADAVLDAEDPEVYTADSEDARLPGAGDDVERARILIADDNADMRQYLMRLLSPRYDVMGVAQGDEALLAVRSWNPDLLLTDVMMPRLDGFGLLEKVRADAEIENLPVIMLSARAGEESRVEGIEAGADDYLVKPFGARELLARVDAQLRNRRKVL